jgi:hypothetical protein
VGLVAFLGIDRNNSRFLKPASQTQDWFHEGDPKNLDLKGPKAFKLNL